MDLDLKEIKRSGYTILDLISDIGGIQGVLFSSFTIFVGVWNHNMIENYLVTKLYRLKPKQKSLSTGIQ